MSKERDLDENARKEADDDLTALALQYPPPDDAPTPGEWAISKLRARPLFAVFFGLLSLVLGSLLVVVVGSLNTHGDRLFCRITGCRPLSIRAALIGFLTLTSIIGFIASLARRQ